LSWHLRGKRHLFVCPSPMDEIKVYSALYLRAALEESGGEAYLLLRDDWGSRIPLHLPASWFIEPLQVAENQKWDKVWCWGYEGPEGFGVDRRGKLKTRKTVLRKLFKGAGDVLQVIGLHDERLVKPFSPEKVQTQIDLSKFNFDPNKSRLDAKAKELMVLRFHKWVDEQKKDEPRTKFHFFDGLGSGGLSELAFYLVRELGVKSNPEFLLRSLVLQIGRFEESAHDPLVLQLRDLLERECPVS